MLAHPNRCQRAFFFIRDHTPRKKCARRIAPSDPLGNKFVDALYVLYEVASDGPCDLMICPRGTIFVTRHTANAVEEHDV